MKHTLARKILFFVIVILLPTFIYAGDSIPKAAWKRGIGEPLANAGTRKPNLYGMIDDDRYVAQLECGRNQTSIKLLLRLGMQAPRKANHIARIDRSRDSIRLSGKRQSREESGDQNYDQGGLHDSHTRSGQIGCIYCVYLIRLPPSSIKTCPHKVVCGRKDDKRKRRNPCLSAPNAGISLYNPASSGQTRSQRHETRRNAETLPAAVYCPVSFTRLSTRPCLRSFPRNPASPTSTGRAASPAC